MRATPLLAALGVIVALLFGSVEAQLNIQSAEDTALNAFSAFKNLQLGRALNTSVSASPLNGTLTCYLDPATSTVVGLGVATTPPNPSQQKAQLCGKTAASESLPIPSPIVAVAVGIQKVGLGVSSLRFSTAGGGGDLFCGYAANTLKTFEATSSSLTTLGLVNSGRGTLASIDAKCANVTGREVLTAGGIALTFTNSAAAGGSFPLYGGARVEVTSRAGSGAGSGDAAAPPPPTPTAPAASPPPSAPATAANPVPTVTAVPTSTPPPPPPPPPSSTAGPPAAAVSWLETVVSADPALSSAVAEAEARGTAAPGYAPPALGVGDASDHVVVGGKLPPPMSSEQAASASAAVADLPTAGAGAGVLPGAGKPAEGNATATMSALKVFDSPLAGAVSASGEGGVHERQQLAGDENPNSPSNNNNENSVVSYASGTSGVSFTDSRAPTYLDDTKKVGQLYVCKAVSNGACSSWSFCTASLVGKSLLVTAGHCVFSYGKKTAGWPSYINGQLQVYFFPQVNNNVAPYGSWAAQDVTVPAPYYAGTDTCARNGPGIVCSNDVALVWLKPGGNTNPPQQAGARLGYNAYGFNNWGMSAPAATTGISSATFQSVFGTLPSVMITQLGYPVAFENGNTLQISAAPAYRYYIPGSETTTGQTMLNLMKGSAVTGGASGGPWIVNYGQDATSLAAGTNYGSYATRDVVVGVTSWGFSSGAVKTSASSVFGQNFEYPAASYGTRGGGNIGYLIDWACDNVSGTWKLQSKGMCT